MKCAARQIAETQNQFLERSAKTAVMWRHLLALTLVGAAEGLYFHVREGERRCFVEEVPDDEIVVGAYTFPEFGKAGEKTKEEHEPTVSEQVPLPQANAPRAHATNHWSMPRGG